ncbi:hypothetical protein LX32DRAFT_131272 [Colletotrichum zoysiae]|uniref:Uncharacterized protein n=1 Tax=Colletotrichum zoysiae TaxID=1216348 RepID=A0AAD9H994_9PEZI|nr:hypothetical protein LX32DRAFT_131272 [Colletotrichum zoysiae]
MAHHMCSILGQPRRWDGSLKEFSPAAVSCHALYTDPKCNDRSSGRMSTRPLCPHLPRKHSALSVLAGSPFESDVCVPSLTVRHDAHWRATQKPLQSPCNAPRDAKTRRNTEKSHSEMHISPAGWSPFLAYLALP